MQGDIIKFWSVEKRRVLHSKGHQAAVGSVAFGPDGQILAGVGRWNMSLRLWSVGQRQEIARFCGHSSWVLSVVYSPEGHLLASGTTDGVIKLWSVANRKAIATLRGHRDIMTALTFSPNGQLLASGLVDSTIKLWDLKPVQSQYRSEGSPLGKDESK